MKKVLLIFLIFLFTTLQLGAIKTSNIPYDFIKEIQKYKSYDKTKLDKYYEEYLKSDNIILSLNSINHPDFFNFEETYISFKFNNQYFVNPKYFLDDDFTPKSLVPVTTYKIHRKNEIMLINNTTQYMYELFLTECIGSNPKLLIFSAYRSYLTQEKNYINAVDKSYVAKAGFSEHQTGYAIDISTKEYGLTTHFENSIEFDILINNIYKYGFILRYPKDKQHITGYPYEPWHFRYVGKSIAKIIYEENITLEEYIFKYVEIC